MVKLKDIYLMEDESFTTKLSNVDPETGSVEWDVKYESMPQRVANHLTQLAPLFKEAEKKTKTPEFTAIYNNFKYLRTKLSKYLKGAKLEEHHGDDFPQEILNISVSEFLDLLKSKSETGYDAVEDIMKVYFPKEVEEANITGTGTSITTGIGAQYTTPNAFLSPKDWKKKIKQMKYVENKK
jgi:hypothetical protein